MTREELIERLSGRDLLVGGHRNDDSVNLAIVVYDDAAGEIIDPFHLFVRINGLIEKTEGLRLTDESDTEYLKDKCKDLFRYLPTWYDTGDIYQYAII